MQQDHAIWYWESTELSDCSPLLSFSLFMLSNCEYVSVSCTILNYTELRSCFRLSPLFGRLNAFLKLLPCRDDMASLGIGVESKKQVSTSDC